MQAAADPVGTGARLLFDRADQALQGRTSGEFAVSCVPTKRQRNAVGVERPAFGDSDRALERRRGVFRPPVALGIRLVYIRPVIDGATGHRLGIVAAERVLSASRGITTPPDEAILSIPTAVPVTVRPHDASLTNLPHTFVITAS
jgi:hypothetical protein